MGIRTVLKYFKYRDKYGFSWNDIMKYGIIYAHYKMRTWEMIHALMMKRNGEKGDFRVPVIIGLNKCRSVCLFQWMSLLMLHIHIATNLDVKFIALDCVAVIANHLKRRPGQNMLLRQFSRYVFAFSRRYNWSIFHWYHWRCIPHVSWAIGLTISTRIFLSYIFSTSILQAVIK